MALIAYNENLLTIIDDCLEVVENRLSGFGFYILKSSTVSSCILQSVNSIYAVFQKDQN